MASGQTALSLTDIPFMYSFVNILFIWIYGIGSADDFTRFYVVGLIAGLIGTFFVYWHPIQWIIDKRILHDKENIPGYVIKEPNNQPPEYEIDINEWFNMSLKTAAIKYLKDKFVSQIYFLIVLVTLSLALSYGDFQKSLQLDNFPYVPIIQFGVLGMIVGIAVFSINQYRNFLLSLKLHSVYFLLAHSLVGFNDRTNMMKQAIDLSDWITTRVMIDKALKQHWGSLHAFIKKK